MRSALSLLTALFLFSLSANASAKEVVDPAPFDALLKKHVDNRGRVNYAAIKKSKKDRAQLESFVKAIGDAKVKGSEKAQLAFYINAYNALVIHSVVEKYPISSVMKVDGFFKKNKHTVAGEKMTLDALENSIIRKKFSEPRIHFVLVCAAKSCPKLNRRAATAANLEGLLESSTKAFVPKATTVKEGKIVTSKLFKWFAGDFEKAEGSVRKYLAKYVPKHKDAILDEKNELTFAHYSWKLNKQ
jgi:hypothetical protein